MKNVLRLHKEAGCKHGELELENFVMRGNDLTSIRLIDFKYARVGHQCKYGDRCARAHCNELDGLEHLLEIFKCGYRYATIL
jgi:tRNA A-37 threonylcarbamoyl transferase component Bud32